MSAALARRDDGCASDLLMDRWLLGEIPGSDEGRRLEEHVRACAGCAARFQALRSLYGTRPPPKVEPPMPPLSAPPRVVPPEHALVMQVVILRDGLLVGTEVFTAGRYTVGRDAQCALKLDDVAPVHASLSLIGERVALEAAGGPIFVNGFRATTCELRPIDEVAVGPYVLRTRVLAERWRRPNLRAVEAELPLPRRGEGRGEGSAALKLELFWGDTCVEVDVVQSPKQLQRYGIQSAQPIDGGFMLDGLRVTHGERARFHVGHLVCIATAVPRAAPVPRKSLREWPWAVTSLAATLAACVVTLGIYGANVEEREFEPRELPRIVVHPFQLPKPKKEPITEHAPAAKAPGPRHPHAGPKTSIAALDKVLQGKGMKDLLAGMKLPVAGKPSKHQNVLAGIGMPQLASNIGLHDSAGIGIGGRPSLAGAGGMKVGKVGHGAVQGSVSHATGRSVHADPGSSIDRDAVAAVINSHLHEISTCYEQAMIQSGAFSGKMLMEWTITTQGSVAASRIKQSDIRNAYFGSCVLGKLNGWRFPAARGGSCVVGYPIILGNVGY